MPASPLARKARPVLELSDINTALEACPPLMREQLQSTYLGKAVHWTLALANAHEDRPGRARLMFRTQPLDIRFVAVGASLARYPWLRGLHSGDLVRLSGRIARFSALAVELEHVKLVRPT